jgi:hypothetical protein
MPPEDIDALVSPLNDSLQFYTSATVIGLLVSCVAGMACVNFTRGVSLDYPILAGIITATLGAVYHREGLAELLSPLRVLTAAATVGAYLVGGMYAISTRPQIIVHNE